MGQVDVYEGLFICNSLCHNRILGVERGSFVNMSFEIVGSSDIALPWLEIWSIFGWVW
jgi:choline-glycine betaine transporter